MKDEQGLMDVCCWTPAGVGVTSEVGEDEGQTLDTVPHQSTH